MPEYGWAYVNLDALKTISGGTGSITFKTDDDNVSGTSAFIYATASHKVGLGINTPGDAVVGTLPAYILDISASAGDTTAVRIAGDLQISGSALISGSIKAESLDVDTIISSSHLIIRDPVIGMGFGDETGETGSVGDRGLILGLAGNLNQAIIWDQTSGSFVMGKVGAQGPDQDAFDIPDGDLSTLRVSDLTASNSVSASVFYGDGSNLTGIAGGGGTPGGSDTQVQFNDGGSFGGSSNFTWDDTTLAVVGNISGSGVVEVGGNLTGTHIVPNTTLTYDLGSTALEWNRLYVEEVIGDIEGAVRFDAVNDEGDSISKGQVVYINGVTGQTPTVALAAADDSNKMPAFGLAGANAAQGANVQIVTFGSLQNLNLSTLFPDETFAEGDPVFVQTGSGGVSGSLTSVAPTGSGNLLQNVGQVVRNGAGGDNQIKVGGAGRSNATPNLDEGYIFIGNSNDQAVQDNTVSVIASTSRVGINRPLPDAMLHLSQSGTGGSTSMAAPMLRIDHPGDASGKPFDEALLFVTGAIPDDYFEARVGINTKTPEGAFHVKTQEGQNTFLVVDDKVVIGNNNAAAKFQVRKSQGGSGDRDVMRIESILNSDDTVHNLFYVTGSTDGTAVFGSFNTGSVLAVSGTAFMTSMHVQYSGTNQDTNVGPRDYIFGVDTSANSPKIFLESAAVAGKGRKIIIKDTGNNAGSNNIKITGSTAGDLIEYSNEALVNSNKGSKTLVSDGASKWFVIGDA